MFALKHYFSTNSVALSKNSLSTEILYDKCGTEMKCYCENHGVISYLVLTKLRESFFSLFTGSRYQSHNPANCEEFGIRNCSHLFGL